MADIIKNTTNSTHQLRKISGNFMRFKGLVMKFLKTCFRDKPLYFWVFGYPLLFMCIYGIGLRGTGAVQYEISFVNYDSDPIAGQTPEEVLDFESKYFLWLFNPDNPDSNLSENFIAYYDYTEIEARAEVNAQNIDAMVILPANFTEMIFNDQEPLVQIYTTSDPMVKSIIPSVIHDIIQQLILAQKDVNTVEVDVEASRNEITIIDWYLPGFVIVGVTVAIMNVTSLFATEKEKGLMQRLDTTPVPRDIQLLAGGAAQLIFSSIQITILMTCLVIFGVQFDPNANIFLAFLNAFVLAITCIGIGLILAAVAKDANAAGGLSWIVILPMQFFGGAFGNLSPGLQKVFPTYYAVNAMRRILISGLGWDAVWQDIMINLGFAVMFIIIGLALFKWKTRV